MQIFHGAHCFNGAAEEREATEVSFYEHEYHRRQRLIDAVEAVDMLRDTELFPERIILDGTFMAVSIYQLISLGDVPKQTTRPQGTLNGVQIERVPASDYL